MINELFPSLPYDLEKPAPAFRPYSRRAEHALAWAKQNWLPIALFIAGVVVV
jgi:hypothetical protein